MLDTSYQGRTYGVLQPTSLFYVAERKHSCRNSMACCSTFRLPSLHANKQGPSFNDPSRVPQTFSDGFPLR